MTHHMIVRCDVLACWNSSQNQVAPRAIVRHDGLKPGRQDRTLRTDLKAFNGIEVNRREEWMCLDLIHLALRTAPQSRRYLLCHEPTADRHSFP